MLLTTLAVPTAALAVPLGPMAVPLGPIAAAEGTTLPENGPTASLADTIRLDEAHVVATAKEPLLMRQQPSAVSMVDREQIDAAHITSVKGLSTVVPNFFMPDYGSHLTSAIYIRGIGTRSGSSAVGLYVDHLPVADKSAFDAGFFDIERVDVLRGPQGTLYGSNTMGGIVQINTRNPFVHQGLDVQLGYATADNSRHLSLVRYHRFSRRFAASYGGNYKGSDGCFTNTLTGQRVDGSESANLRFRGRYHHNDRLTLDFTTSYDITDEGAYPYFSADNGTIAANRESTYNRHVFNFGLNTEYRADAFVMNSITGYQLLRDRMFMDQDFLPSDLYTLEQRQRLHSLTEELTFRQADRSARWQWVSGIYADWKALHTDGPVVFYADGLRWLETNLNRVMPTIDQIPMLQRMGFTGMGLNFRGDQLLMDGHFSTPALSLAAFHQSTVDITPHLSATAGLRFNFERLTMRYAAPADVAYGFDMPNAANDRMSISLQQLESHIAYDGSLTDNYITLLPKFALKYDFGALGNVYASAAMGQRSGGYNLQMFSDLLQGKLRVDMMDGVRQGVGAYLDQLAATPGIGMPPYIPDPDNPGAKVTLADYVTRIMGEKMPHFEAPTVEQVVYRPEYSWNYELGAHLSPLGSRLQLDAAAFVITTRNLQIARFAPSGLGRMMVNAGKSRNIGGEFSAIWRPDSHWALTANYGYTHARFTDYDAGDGADYTGNVVPFVPRHTIHADAAYTWHFATDDRPSQFAPKALTLAVDYSGAGTIYWTEDNTVRQPYYSLLGARLQFQTRLATFQLWARNLTATRYNTFYFVSAGHGFEQHGKPFQVGIDVKLDF